MKLNSVFLLVFVVSLLGLFIPTIRKNSSRKKLEMYGKNTDQQGLQDSMLDKVFALLSPDKQLSVLRYLRKSGLDVKAKRDLFTSSSLRIVLLIGGGSILGFIMTNQILFVFTGLGSVVMIAVRFMKLIDDISYNITINSQVLIRVLRRELSRSTNYMSAFKKAYHEVEEGRLKYILQEVCRVLEASKGGDVRGAINLMRDLGQHELLDLLWSALETSLMTSKQGESLERLETRVSDRIEEAIRKSTNNRKVFAYMNSIFVIACLMLQFLFVIMGKFQFNINF